jgi:hypothetical protein
LCRYSTCWGWPELGQYHTCVGYWSGYYASRPSIKQVPGPYASPLCITPMHHPYASPDTACPY